MKPKLKILNMLVNVGLRQGTLTEGKGSVWLTSSIRKVVFVNKKITASVWKAAVLNYLVQGGQP